MNPIAKKENIVVQQIKNEIMIYDLSPNKAFLLNKTASFVWNMCDGINDVAKIRKALAQTAKKTINEEFIWFAIEVLKKHKLLMNGDLLPSPFKNVNRREVIKKVGLATMITLPIISSLTAPTSVIAASCAGLGAACPQPPDYEQSFCCDNMFCNGTCRNCLSTGTVFTTAGTGRTCSNISPDVCCSKNIVRNSSSTNCRCVT